MPHQLLKFLNSANVDDILVRGTIRVSTFSYFGRLEGGLWIGDPNEATTVVNADGAVLASRSGESVADSWTPPGFGTTALARDGGKITFSSELKYQMPDQFIFCASQGDRNTLIQAMCRDAKDPYDAAIQIRIPLDLLAHRILFRGTIVELHNEPVRRVFGAVTSGLVAYDAVEHHHASGLAPAPFPFSKHPDFAAQSEARIVLNPVRDLGHDRLTIRLPHAEKIFTEEFRNVPPLNAPTYRQS
jgi:hypothetical protein